MRGIARQPVEVGQRQGACRSIGRAQLHRGVQDDQRDGQVGGMAGDAVIARPEDREHAVLALDRGAAGAGSPLVAGETGVAEIAASCALQQVPADCAHVADLRRGGGEQRLRDHRPACDDGRMRGHVAHARHRAEAQRVVRRGDLGEGQRLEIDQPVGCLDVVLRKLQQVGAAADVAAALRGGCGRRLEPIGRGEGEGLHELSPPARSRGSPRRCWDRRRSGRCCRSSTPGFPHPNRYGLRRSARRRT